MEPWELDSGWDEPPEPHGLEPCPFDGPEDLADDVALSQEDHVGDDLSSVQPPELSPPLLPLSQPPPVLLGATLPGQELAQRRRLRGKQARPTLFPELPLDTPVLGRVPAPSLPSVKWDHWQQSEFMKLDHRARYNRVYRRFRKKQRRSAPEASVPLAAEEALCDPTADDSLMDRVRDWLCREQAPEWLVDYWCECVRPYSVLPPDEAAPSRAASQSHLLTWNGSWGCLGALPDVSLSPVEKACAALRRLSSVAALWLDFHSFVTRAARTLGVAVHAAAIELCSETSTPDSVRVHAHALSRCLSRFAEDGKASLGGWV